ncbi:endonuclease NucS domain-containing protein [Colwellia sp. MB3u-28]|uniref:endonuclease NucS domain-containing protein n=1 Tax=Colwellia sp. MB3u-28 TaxID=2759812 RepID=UPI0015F38614|nr:endonuclease NucS domain-containing protein [Colwellia sp. MB3u-28]MBA6256763.1 DUF91 domain-containing protein [Colwellia sp. MB3u-28]
MENKFKQWLIEKGNEDKVSIYPSILHLISKHYSEQVGYPVDLYNVEGTKKLASLYGRKGKFTNFGSQESGAFRSAISSYCKFHKHLKEIAHYKSMMGSIQNYIDNDDEHISDLHDLHDVHDLQDLQDLQVTDTNRAETLKTSATSMNFEYEVDLQTQICSQIPELFPEYVIFGGISVGVEYEVGSRKIDILLENTNDGSLLVVELKSGRAGIKVIDQIYMYISLIRRVFPKRGVTGVIIAGKIDDSLIQASKVNSLVSIMTYSIGVQLNKT